MQCEIYKGKRKEDTYLYLEAPADFECLPDNIKAIFGEFFLVMELEICEGTKLAREKATNVLANIEANGFHIQLPPKDYIPDII